MPLSPSRHLLLSQFGTGRIEEQIRWGSIITSFFLSKIIRSESLMNLTWLRWKVSIQCIWTLSRSYHDRFRGHLSIQRRCNSLFLGGFNAFHYTFLSLCRYFSSTFTGSWWDAGRHTDAPMQQQSFRPKVFGADILSQHPWILVLIQCYWPYLQFEIYYSQSFPWELYNHALFRAKLRRGYHTFQNISPIPLCDLKLESEFDLIKGLWDIAHRLRE